MKHMFMRSLTLAILASSISAFAAVAPAKDDPPKEEKTSTTCAPADASNMQKADRRSKRGKKMGKKMKKPHDPKQDDNYPFSLGIYG